MAVSQDMNYGYAWVIIATGHYAVAHMTMDTFYVSIAKTLGKYCNAFRKKSTCYRHDE